VVDQVYKPRLTGREKQVAALIIDGLTVRQAATELGIHHRTAANILTRVYEKLGIHHRTELTRAHLD